MSNNLVDDNFLNEHTNCIICFEEYSDSKQKLFLECSHSYCEDCINKFYKSGLKNCPQCRNIIDFKELGYICPNIEMTQDIENYYHRLETPNSSPSGSEVQANGHANGQNIQIETVRPFQNNNSNTMHYNPPNVSREISEPLSPNTQRQHNACNNACKNLNRHCDQNSGKYCGCVCLLFTFIIFVHP
jgi:hypothetical protein